MLFYCGQALVRLSLETLAIAIDLNGHYNVTLLLYILILPLMDMTLSLHVTVLPQYVQHCHRGAVYFVQQFTSS